MTRLAEKRNQFYILTREIFSINVITKPCDGFSIEISARTIDFYLFPCLHVISQFVSQFLLHMNYMERKITLHEFGAQT